MPTAPGDLLASILTLITEIFTGIAPSPKTGIPLRNQLTCHLADDFRRDTGAGARTLEPDTHA